MKKWKLDCQIEYTIPPPQITKTWSLQNVKLVGCEIHILWKSISCKIKWKKTLFSYREFSACLWSVASWADIWRRTNCHRPPWPWDTKPPSNVTPRDVCGQRWMRMTRHSRLGCTGTEKYSSWLCYLCDELETCSLTFVLKFLWRINQIVRLS